MKTSNNVNHKKKKKVSYMENYSLEEKESFIVVGIGTEL
jgi:hypothetical protein